MRMSQGENKLARDKRGSKGGREGGREPQGGTGTERRHREGGRAREGRRKGEKEGGRRGERERSVGRAGEMVKLPLRFTLIQPPLLLRLGLGQPPLPLRLGLLGSSLKQLCPN